MKILVDTRQKAGKHTKKHAQMEAMGHELIFTPLTENSGLVGDYMRSDDLSVSVDTKQNLTEVNSNIFSDTSRFMKEVRRAFEAHIKLYVLIEHGGGIKDINDVPSWKPKYGCLNSRRLYDRMCRISIAYGVEFLFCDKRVTGRRIIEILENKDERC